MERDFYSKGGTPACVNCSSFSNHSQVVSIKELGSLSHVIKTFNAIACCCFVSATSSS